MSNTATALLVAIVTTAIVVGPVIALLWFSWRAVVVGALSIGAVLLFFGSIMVAGNTGWQPGGNPYLIVVVGWTITAILAFSAYWLAGKGTGVKALNIIFGYAVLVWALTMRHHVDNAWWVVAHPEPPSTAPSASRR